MKYLYGASVMQIQEFIFKTNALKEIIGASEIVKSLVDKVKTFLSDQDKSLINDAGRVMILFDTEAAVKKIVKELPRCIMKEAYGITIYQAVVKIEKQGPSALEYARKKLEKRLSIQRNRVDLPLDMSINLMELYARTGRPKVDEDADMATRQKLKACPKDEKFKELSDISNSKNKIAVIHADGNDLGQIVSGISIDGLSSFSTGLGEATTEVFKNAKSDGMKIRKIILGGDDLTVICDANDALAFTQRFLKNFEYETEQQTGYRLSACAGIAFCNEKYPMHYAVDLAEALCKHTKEHAKALKKEKALTEVPSSLMFHNVQSANFQTYKKSIKDELTIENDNGPIRLDFGPYYLDGKYQPSMLGLQNMVSAYACTGSPITRLRAWLSELSNGDAYAEKMLRRINEMAEKNKLWKHCIMDNNLKALDLRLSNDTLLIKDNLRRTPIYRSQPTKRVFSLSVLNKA